MQSGGAIVILRKDGFLDINYSNMYNSSKIDDLVVPLTAADVTTTANVPDNKMYVSLTASSFSVSSLPWTLYGS
jgi:hypothetical protein